MAQFVTVLKQFIQYHIDSDAKLRFIIIPNINNINNIFWQAYESSLGYDQNVIWNNRFHQCQFIYIFFYISDQEDLLSKNHPQ